MTDVLMVAMGLFHLAALAGLILWYCRHMGLPWREWPLALFLLLWATLVLTGVLVSMFDVLDSLTSYFCASFVAVWLVLWAHHATCAEPRKTPYAKMTYPQFAAIKGAGMQDFLWVVLIGSLIAAVLLHLTVCFSFNPVNADSLNYRLARVFWYVSNGNLLHPFDSVDKRLTYYPVNGMLIYAPFVLYGVSAVFFALPSLLAWIGIGYATYRFARALKAEPLIATFAAWFVAMTPSILIEASSTNDEILTAAPLIIGAFFVWRWLTSGAEHYLFLAAIGLGLCIGTKLHVFFLMPIAIMAALWFLWFLRKRKESWRKWMPAVRLRVFFLAMLAIAFYGLLFLLLNYFSTGEFYFLEDTARQVLNLKGSLQNAFQNLIIYVSSMLFAPIADLNFWETFREREITNHELNSYFLPLLSPFVDNDPSMYHLTYRFRGVIIPTSVLLVEYGLWPAFMWLAWPLQIAGLLKQKLTLKPFFIVIAATPIVWLIIWSCVTLYMEGVPTYFAFYLMCAAPAMVFIFAQMPKSRGNTVRWWVIGFLLATNLIVDGNVAYNNTFRGLWHFTTNKPWPFDWLLFEKPIIDEIQRAKKIHIAITHGKVYYFAFMHWNPKARYYSPYVASPKDPDILHILSTPSEAFYGFMPLKIANKPTPGITYLGHIRGVDRDEIFAFGNNVEKRYPEQSNFITLHMDVRREGDKYKATIDPLAAGLNAEDRLQFEYRVQAARPDGAKYQPALPDPAQKDIAVRPWNASAGFSFYLPNSPEDKPYLITISVRQERKPAKVDTVTFAIGGDSNWRIVRPGASSINEDEDF
ncbi:MAG: ArnT family glycosyltransferase [Bdellovibrionales bacterium]